MTSDMSDMSQEKNTSKTEDSAKAETESDTKTESRSESGSPLSEGSGKIPDDKTGLAEKDPEELGGPSGPEPTRYGDWEIGGKCVDF